jgi:Cu/Ag efflux protein CusF
MIKIKTILGFIATISLMLTVTTPAADSKTFRADGTIQRMSGNMVLVRTSAQDIEITRDAKTKITGELRRGAAVTVIYDKVGGQPHATEITIKK